jgi:hypothetical protein
MTGKKKENLITNQLLYQLSYAGLSLIPQGFEAISKFFSCLKNLSKCYTKPLVSR